MSARFLSLAIALSFALASLTTAVFAQEAASDRPPRLLRFVEADYPPDARASGTQATVLLLLTIESNGHVSDATVAESAGDVFDQAALTAARQFEFTPALQTGRAITARIRYRYRFVLHPSASLEAEGPDAVLRGTVRDTQNRAVAAAEVSVLFENGNTLQQQTDASGAFHIDLTSSGTLSVSINASGFRPYRSEELVAPRDDLQVIYRLSALASSTPSSALNDSEQSVTVRGTRPPREVTRTTIDRREIMRIPGTGGDALRAIQNLPGLARPSFLSGALVVRGSSPDDTRVLADGTELPLLYHFGGLSSVIPTEMLDRIDFYPGNFSSRYGRAMGGIVDVGLRSPRSDGYHGVVNISAIDASVFAEGPIAGNFSVALAARRSWVDTVLGAVLSNFPGVGFTATPVYWDYQGILEWRPTPHHRVRLAVFGDDDRLTVLFHNPNDTMPQFAGQIGLTTQFHIAQLSWVADLAPGTRMTTMASLGWTSADIAAGEALRFNIVNIPFTFRYELSHSVSRILRLNLGVDIYSGPVSASFSTTGSSSEQNPAGNQRSAANISLFEYHPAAYAEAEVTPIEGLRLVPSVRVDWFREIGQGIVQPRMSFRWAIPLDFALKGGVGLYAGPPPLQDTTTAPNIYLPGSTIGNPHLSPVRAMHYSLGIERAFTNIRVAPWLANLTLSLEGFYKVLDNLPVATAPSAIIQQPSTPPYTSIGTGHVIGLEVLLRYRPTQRFFGWIAYTLMRSTRSDGPGLPEHLYDFDQTHILTVVGSLRLAYGFEVGLRFRYVTGNLVTPTIGSTYSTDSLTYIPISGAINSERLSDFHQLDLRIDKTFHFRSATIGLYLEVLNVYNQSNPEGYQYNYNYTQRAPINGLPVFPNVGIRGEI